jgi:hypothetical protein
MRAENHPDCFCRNIGIRTGFCKKKLEFPGEMPPPEARK